MTIEQQILELQDKATAASRACIKYMDSQNPQTTKYLESLRKHGEATKEINRLKKMLDETQS